MEKSLEFTAVISYAEETTNGRSKCGVTLSQIKEIGEKDGKETTKDVDAIDVVAKGVVVKGDGITISWKNLLKAFYSNRVAKLVGMKTANQPQTSTAAKGILTAMATGAPIRFIREYYKPTEINPDTNQPLTEPYIRTIIKTASPSTIDNNDFMLLFSAISADCDAKGLPKTNGNGLQFMM